MTRSHRCHLGCILLKMAAIRYRCEQVAGHVSLYYFLNSVLNFD
eukprot:COSAG04_NODE_1558_length_6355_cov_4.489610_3_plen_44_part_00